MRSAMADFRLLTKSMKLSQINCKACGSPTEHFADVAGGSWPGFPERVPYQRCKGCGLVFTTWFDDWTRTDWREKVYNADYVKVDPHYVEERPKTTAALLAASLPRSASLLDYGGGSGLMANLLIAQGFDAECYEVMRHEAPPNRRFPFVSAIEVLEHSPDPAATVAQMASLLADGGVLFLSTLCLSSDKTPPRDHWYIAPRNGHVSVCTKKTLRILLATVGMDVIHLNDSVHIGYKRGGLLSAFSFAMKYKLAKLRGVHR